MKETIIFIIMTFSISYFIYYVLIHKKEIKEWIDSLNKRGENTTTIKKDNRIEKILLCGKSGSGKDYISELFNLVMIITHTTRPKRNYEVDHVHKHFHKAFKNEKDALDVITDSSTIAWTKRGEYYYWATMLDIESGNVYIIDVPGIQSIMNNRFANARYKFKVVYLGCPIYKRICNMLKRGEKIGSIISRLYIDYRDFKKLENIKHTTIKF